MIPIKKANVHTSFLKDCLVLSQTFDQSYKFRTENMKELKKLGKIIKYTSVRSISPTS